MDHGAHQRDEAHPPTRRGSLFLGIGVILLVVAAVCWFFWGGVFRFQPENGETFWHLLHQKGHWYLEVLVGGVETILFDLVIVVIGWRYLLKPYVAHRQERAVAEDHALHGIEDHDGPTEDVTASTERRPT